VLTGLGAAAVAGWLTAGPASLRAGVATAGVCGALLLQASWYLPRVRAVGEEAWAARADVAYARAFPRTLPANAIVLTHNPGMFHVWGANAAQLSIAAGDPQYVRNELSRRYAGGVFIHHKSAKRSIEELRAFFPL
jgi:hypothetical protein